MLQFEGRTMPTVAPVVPLTGSGVALIAFLIPACGVLTSAVAGNLAAIYSEFAPGRAGFPVASTASPCLLQRSLNRASTRSIRRVSIREKVIRRGRPIALFAAGSTSALTRLAQAIRTQACVRNLGP